MVKLLRFQAMFMHTIVRVCIRVTNWARAPTSTLLERVHNRVENVVRADVVRCLEGRQLLIESAGLFAVEAKEHYLSGLRPDELFERLDAVERSGLG